MDLLADGLTVAEEAQQLWLQIIANGTQEEVYAASRACINGYLDVYKYSEAAASASWVLASLPPDVHPRTTAMVKRLQIYALGKAQQYDDIITLTQSFDSAFSASQDYQVLDEWATGLIFASAFCARAGSPEWGTYCLDQADSRYHEWRSDGFIAAESADHRAVVARVNQQQ
jgi:hypothetical protein